MGSKEAESWLFIPLPTQNGPQVSHPAHVPSVAPNPDQESTLLLRLPGGG